MNGKYRILLFLVLIIIIWKSFQLYKLTPKNASLKPSQEKIKISVYYEALCPDSKFFITHQLQQVYEKIPNNLDLDLVPYGKARTVVINGKIEFYCQHDAVECLANKIHACVINKVTDPMLQLKYVACMINDNMIPDDAGEKCARELNLDYTPFSDCANSDKGSELLKSFGERTNSLNPPVKFIPTIELNGSQTIVSQSLILKDLLKALCEIFKDKPSECGW